MSVSSLLSSSVASSLKSLPVSMGQIQNATQPFLQQTVQQQKPIMIPQAPIASIPIPQMPSTKLSRSIGYDLSGFMFRFLVFMTGSLFLMFLIFGLVQLGLSGEREYQGKFIILGISMILGLGGALLFPVIIKKMYPMLEAI